MNGRLSLYRGGIALLIAAALVACSGGSGGITPAGSQSGNMHSRRPMSWNVGVTQPIANATMISPLTLSLNGTVGQAGLFGSTSCAAPSGPNPCPNINFTASPPQYYNSADVSMTLAAVTLNAACTPPAGTATPSPGFVPACYIVTYEGGVGPYVLQGPATASGGTLSFPANTSTLYFQGLTPYNVFLAYVTSVASTPPSPTPSPVPTASGPTLAPTPTVSPSPQRTASPIPSPAHSASPSPCPSATWDDDRRDEVHVVKRGDDDEGRCASPTPRPAPTCDDGDGHHKHRDRRDDSSRRGDDDCWDRVTSLAAGTFSR